MAEHDIVVIGASAGGVEALSAVVRALPADLPAAVFVVLHVAPHTPSKLPEILDRVGTLPAHHATDGAPIELGRIYVAPPDHHLLVERDRVRVVRGPRENLHRPGIDPLFRSAARAYGPRVVGMVLTGALDDGTAGLLAIKQRGGVAVVQDPADALYASMPQSAIDHVAVDHVVPLAEIVPLLVQLTHAPADEEGAFPVSDAMKLETNITKMDAQTLANDARPGTPSAFSCPECKGVLYEVNDNQFVRFRCRTGHAYTAESVLAEQADAIEDALWIALNTLEENAKLARRMYQQAQDRRQTMLTARFAQRVQDAEQRAEVIRQVLLGSAPLDQPPGESDDGTVPDQIALGATQRS